MSGQSSVTTQNAAPGQRLGGAYSRLWVASSLSAVGDGMTLTAGPLVAASFTSDPRLVAGVTMALTLPYVLLGLPAGVLVDRVRLRPAMAGIDFVRAAAVGTLAVVLVTGHASLVLLYLVFFLIGAGETFFRNASQVLVPSLVPGPLLVEANARMMAAQTAGNQFVGPLVGSAFFAFAAALPFGIDATTFLLSAVLLTSIRLASAPGAVAAPVTPDPARRRPSLLADLPTGARWLARHRLLRNLALVAAMANLAQTGGLAVLVVHSHEVLHLGDFGYGVILACQAAGAVLAARIAPRFVRWIGGERVLVGVACAMGCGNVLAWLIPQGWAVGLALALVACAGVTWDVVVVVLRQTLVPVDLQGRVNSVYRLVAWGAMPLGAGLAGLVAHAWGTTAVFGLSALIMAGLAVRLAAGARSSWFSAYGVSA
ncbi:MFS transporter [Microbispora sp. RL4-1S]|uniref:MFS transporter n=1 Tax=Microbispora oryzae TaxID=2806554 RepID=A0A940WGW6_9ACTN|nr:MFS transporter [Microbispora oryzae]MBP2705469.1 MFS transporter [Microbispora oryzae]